MSPLDSSRLRYEAVRIARANIGYGEHNRNFLAAIGARADYEWCAIYAGYCYRKAAANLKLQAPAWAYRRLNVPEPGAKRLTRNLGAAGSAWTPGECDSYRPKLGDLVCWTRGLLGWTGHVGIVSELMPGGWFRSIEGNIGGKVVERLHSFSEPKLWRFASVDQ